MYLTSPISATFCLTSSVNATGEKTARAPDCKRTTILSYCDESWPSRSVPIVPRPPTFILPKRRNGTESVVMVRGTTSRMTITFSGSFGMSLEDIV